MYGIDLASKDDVGTFELDVPECTLVLTENHEITNKVLRSKDRLTELEDTFIYLKKHGNTCDAQKAYEALNSQEFQVLCEYLNYSLSNSPMQIIENKIIEKIKDGEIFLTNNTNIGKKTRNHNKNLVLPDENHEVVLEHASPEDDLWDISVFCDKKEIDRWIGFHGTVSEVVHKMAMVMPLEIIDLLSEGKVAIELT